jgi:hypothetical protein
METTFVCPACRAVHCEPAGAAFVLGALCLACELADGYHSETWVAVAVKAAA